MLIKLNVNFDRLCFSLFQRICPTVRKLKLQVIVATIRSAKCCQPTSS